MYFVTKKGHHILEDVTKVLKKYLYSPFSLQIFTNFFCLVLKIWREKKLDKKSRKFVEIKFLFFICGTLTRPPVVRLPPKPDLRWWECHLTLTLIIILTHKIFFVLFLKIEEKKIEEKMLKNWRVKKGEKYQKMERKKLERKNIFPAYHRPNISAHTLS